MIAFRKIGKKKVVIQKDTKVWQMKIKKLSIKFMDLSLKLKINMIIGQNLIQLIIKTNNQL